MELQRQLQHMHVKLDQQTEEVQVLKAQRSRPFQPVVSGAHDEGQGSRSAPGQVASGPELQQRREQQRAGAVSKTPEVSSVIRCAFTSC